MMAALRSDPDVVEKIFDLLLSRQTDKDVNRCVEGVDVCVCVCVCPCKRVCVCVSV